MPFNLGLGAGIVCTAEVGACEKLSHSGLENQIKRIQETMSIDEKELKSRSLSLSTHIFD